MLLARFGNTHSRHHIGHQTWEEQQYWHRKNEPLLLIGVRQRIYQADDKQGYKELGI